MIFLVGMPGAGKTHWLKSFSEVLRYEGVDLDEKIEKRYQRPISRVFKNKERDFRIAEREALVDIIDNYPHNTIVATGGGTPVHYNNLEEMKNAGIVVYLKAEFDIIFQNLAKNLNKRPFLPKTKQALVEHINQLMLDRSPYYEQADLILPVKYLNVTFFYDQIKPLLDERE